MFKLNTSLSLALLLVFNCSTSVFAQIDSQRKQLKNEIQSIFYTIENNYGPLAFKQKQGIINWAQLKENTLKKIDSINETRDYYFLVSELLYSFNDAHVSITIPSNYIKSLPVQFSSVQNKAIINYVDTANLAKAKPTCILNIGDELTSINGLPLQEAHKKSLELNAQGNPITNRSYFLMSLSNLNESKGLDISSENAFFGGDQIKFTLLDVNLKTKKYCTLNYQISGSTLVSRKIPTEKEEMQYWLGIQNKSIQESQKISSSNGANITGVASNDPKVQLLLKNYFRLMKISGYSGAGVEHLLDDSVKKYSMNDNYYFPNGANKNNIRANVLGTKIALGHEKPLWPIEGFKQIKGARLIEADNLHAGIINQGNRKIGYIRIPSYMPKNIMFAHYGVRKIVAQLEAETDYLIIDQINNPGGAVVYSDMIIKSLVGKFDYKSHMTFSLKPTQSFVRTYIEIFEDLKKIIVGNNSTTNVATGSTPNNESQKITNLITEVNKQSERIRTCYQANNFLCVNQSLLPLSELFEISTEQTISDNLAFRTIAKLNFGSESLNNPTYTKPIYMLINELDFSGGDATPANLKDYNRVTLIGVRTAGAGGTVEEIENRVMNQFSYRLTTSLMVRKDGSYVENLGVHPDVKFEFNELDIKTNYKNTFSRIKALTDQLYNSRKP